MARYAPLRVHSGAPAEMHILYASTPWPNTTAGRQKSDKIANVLHANEDRIRVTEEHHKMPKLSMAAMALAAPALLTVPATASPITYDLSPSVISVVNGSGGTDTVTGTFTFDQTGSLFGATLNAVNLTVTGPVNPGTYNTPLGSPPHLSPERN
jgi:hypothetical protein